MDFDGVVLCGGASRRMGRDKALVEVDGSRMAVRVADALRRAGATGVTALGGDRVALEREGLTVVPDQHPGEGPLGAVAQALGSVGGAPGVAILSCDLLAPSAGAIRSLVARLGVDGADVVVPSAHGRPQWTHAVWHRRVAGVVADVFASGERSLHATAAGLDVRHVTDVPAEHLADADRPGDLPRDLPPDVPGPPGRSERPVR